MGIPTRCGFWTESAYPWPATMLLRRMSLSSWAGCKLKHSTRCPIDTLLFSQKRSAGTEQSFGKGQLVWPRSTSQARHLATMGVDTATPELVTEPNALWQLILSRYEAAQQAGAAYKTNVHTELLHDKQHNIDFVLRIAAALRDKPKPPSDSKNKKEARNPFLPYDEALWVEHLSPTHTLLLNKFNVVDHHVLVVTREFESQRDPLNGHDLSAAWQVLQAMPEGGVAYYNCGPDSGASQTHKHLQAVPLPFAPRQPALPPFHHIVEAECRRAGDDGDAAAPVAVPLRRLPFRSHACLLPSRPSGEQLEAAVQELYRAIHTPEGQPPASYNVLLSRQFMQVVPRRTEFCGPVAVNSLGFSGTLLVRSVEELEFLKARGPLHVLEAVGLPW